MLDLPQRAVWIATGNNISIGGDLARRSYWIRMDASMARPWLRGDFKHDDLLGWIRANHAGILSDLLTMARAWVVAGRPVASSKAIGGFKEWSDAVGGILEFAGVQGFLANASELYDSMDQDVHQWDEFLEAWAEIHADHSISAGQLRDELVSIDQIHRTLQDAMPDDVAEAVGKDRRRSLSLGHVLRRHLDQIYPSGRRLCQEKDTHAKTSLWKVCGICGILEKNESQSAEGFAGFAGFHPIPRLLHENPIVCIEVEQNPANPAYHYQEMDQAKSRIPQIPQGPSRDETDPSEKSTSSVEPTDSLDKGVTTPAEKSRLWGSLRLKLKKYCRKDGSRRGLAMGDLLPEEVELIQKDGWIQETTDSGISILWAPEKTLKAMGLEAEA